MSSSTSTSDADDDDSASSPARAEIIILFILVFFILIKKAAARAQRKQQKQQQVPILPTTQTTTALTIPTPRDAPVVRKENDALVLVGCDCLDADLASAHKSCACRWFAPRARGVATGFALDPEWSLTWTCECEVCLAPLGASLLRDVVDVCKRALRSDPARHHRHSNRRRFSAPSGTGD
jgi:hypothetical protein